MLSDIDLAKRARLKPISEIAALAGLEEDEFESYGRFKAKVDLRALEKRRRLDDGKLIYVTALTPTPAGEGKTCTAVGLTQALAKLNQRVILTLREPSLGPTFGVKGGAAGGGYAQVLPMEEINLHFTGDLHAVTAAHNLLAALIDNHLYQGNQLRIDPKQILWRRVMDISDRSLRNTLVGLGGKIDGVVRESGFDITVASEIMALLCLVERVEDLKTRLGSMLVAYTYDGRPVFARDLKATGAMAVLLKDALRPNLVQTMEGQPTLIHGGPFANIAHGNNSVIATRLALKLADYVVTEGGFGSDLGAEKFFDIVSPLTGITPSAVVLVASVRALKSHGGILKPDLDDCNLQALAAGLPNLERHLYNLREVFGLPLVVAINRFPTDHPQEVQMVLDFCKQKGVSVEVSEVVSNGGAGGIDLARTVIRMIAEEKNSFSPLYKERLSIKEKINLIATKVYGADGVSYTKEAEKSLAKIRELELERLPVCIAKTQVSLSDDSKLKGAPRGWTLKIRDLRIAAGAGFIIGLAGEILTMPGLPPSPAAERIDLLPDGTIAGLF